MIRNSALLPLVLIALMMAPAMAGATPVVQAAPQILVAKKAVKKKATKKSKKWKRQKWPIKRGKTAGKKIPSMGPAPFAPGERLLYDVKMLGAHAGQAILAAGAPTKHKGRMVQPVVGFIRSSEFLNKFYPVENRMVVLLDQKSYLPLKTDFYIKENGKSLDYHTTYDHRKRLVYSLRRKSGKTLKRNFTPAAALYEPLGSVYAARRMNLSPGQRFDYYLWDGRKERHVKVHAVGVERVWTQLGWIEAMKIELSTTISGGFVKKKTLNLPARKGTVWLATDEFRTPIKMISPTKLGDAEAVLVRRYHEDSDQAPALMGNIPPK